jgi:Trypsin-like peptidase domain
LSIPFKPRDFADAALLLTVRIDTDLGGEECTGTGFLCRVDDGDGFALALVSNRHVFRDGQGTIELRFHAATEDGDHFELGETVILKGDDFTHRYVPHPSSEIDLAAAIVNAIGLEAKGLMLATSQIADQDQLKDLRCGDEIWFVGYPTGWRDEVHNLPLVRRGWVASLPWLDFDGRPEFVIDAQAFPGSSGSPVFAMVGDEMKLVGALVETREEPAPVAGAGAGAGAFLGPLTVNEVVGLGIVIRSTEIFPLLDAVKDAMRKIIGSQ